MCQHKLVNVINSEPIWKKLALACDQLINSIQDSSALTGALQIKSNIEEERHYLLLGDTFFVLQWWFNVISLTLHWSELEHHQSHRAVIPTLPDKLCKKGVSCSGIFSSTEPVWLLLPSLYLCKSTDLLYPVCMSQQWPTSLFLTSSHGGKELEEGCQWSWGCPWLVALCPGTGRSTQETQAKAPGSSSALQLLPRSRKHQPRHGRNPRGAQTS